jgi:RsiW-degrading membrane proteinase PrsW (M82 family)
MNNMQKEDLIKKLEAMQKPEIVSESHRAHLKLTLLNAKRSAKIGVFLIVIPCLFLIGIFLKYLLHINLTTFSSLLEWMSDKDKNPVLHILIPLILIGAPVVGFALNMLAILHVEWNKIPNEIIITLKLKRRNLIIAFVCAVILVCFFIYAVGENF